MLLNLNKEYGTRVTRVDSEVLDLMPDYEGRRMLQPGQPLTKIEEAYI